MTTPDASLPATVLHRKAVVYVRQSTPQQVQSNLESQRRQYELVELARRRGFAEIEVIDAAFHAYGLPLSIRCDNGAPFGSTGAGGLTRLSAWWLKLGVEPHFIRPASPQENGRHERMHRTLKAQTSRPPAELYASSPRAMPSRIEDPWYDANHQVRRVRNAGEIKWRGESVFISEVLVGELIGIAELETGDQVVRFCDLDIGLIDTQGWSSRFAPPRRTS